LASVSLGCLVAAWASNSGLLAVHMNVACASGWIGLMRREGKEGAKESVCVSPSSAHPLLPSLPPFFPRHHLPGKSCTSGSSSFPSPSGWTWPRGPWPWRCVRAWKRTWHRCLHPWLIRRGRRAGLSWEREGRRGGGEWKW
jgi:hypothetical protein